MLQIRPGGAQFITTTPAVQVVQPVAGGFIGPYEVIPSIAAAYGMRRLLGSYTGPILRLRRSSDNAEQDFGYLLNGDVDAAAIATFIGGGSGFVVTWYDQSGNTRNANQATIANQPLYVASGKNGKPTIRFDGVNDQLPFTPTIAATGELSIIVPVSSTGDGYVLYASGNSGQIRYGEGGANILSAYNTIHAPKSSTLSTPRGSWLIADWILSAGTMAFYENGISRSSAALSTIPVNSISGPTPLNGDIAEVVIANSAWSTANRQAAEAAANAYWGVF